MLPEHLDIVLSAAPLERLLRVRDEISLSLRAVAKASINPQCFETVGVRNQLEFLRSLEGEIQRRSQDESLKIAEEALQITRQQSKQTVASIWVSIVAVMVAVLGSVGAAYYSRASVRAQNEANALDIIAQRPWLVIQEIEEKRLVNPQERFAIGDTISLNWAIRVVNIGSRPARYQLPSSPIVVGLSKTTTTQSTSGGPVAGVLLPGEKLEYEFHLANVIVQDHPQYSVTIQYNDLLGSETDLDKRTKATLMSVPSNEMGVRDLRTVITEAL